MTKQILDTGNGAVARAVKMANIDFVAAYPITPQTSISEKLAKYIEGGELDANYLAVEGEHSAMAAVTSACLAGARVFTATSSQGLLYMHEILHYAGSGRLPLVLVNVNRAICPPWSLYVDHHDSLSQRDTGFIQLYCSTTQEIFDTVLQAYKIAEKIYAPVMVNYDGFILSHSMMNFEIPSQEDVDKFLPPFNPVWSLHPSNGGGNFGNVTPPHEYLPFRENIHLNMIAAQDVIDEVAKEYYQLTGQYHGGVIEAYNCDDAEYFLVSMGSMASEMELVVDRYREEGKKVGAIRIRSFRPFPKNALLELLPNNAKVCIFDRNYGFGTGGGILESETKAALFDKGSTINVVGTTLGLGGQDLPDNLLYDVANELMALAEVEK